MMYVLEYLIYHLKPYGVGVIQQCSSPPSSGQPHNTSRTARSSQIPGREGVTVSSKTESDVKSAGGSGGAADKGSTNSFLKTSTEGSLRVLEGKSTAKNWRESVATGGKEVTGSPSFTDGRKETWKDRLKVLLEKRGKM